MKEFIRFIRSLYCHEWVESNDCPSNTKGSWHNGDTYFVDTIYLIPWFVDDSNTDNVMDYIDKHEGKFWIYK